ncbi:hypothetical protein NDI76_16405 [Halogeometricum sp. S1BR25-6]|uniref:Uncharacterized protein n=1 Tax=Halogeometricum salsisoli TaxID=2950536 RepID=A0ABU2GHR6_9EURY|nr:hypothetical protein [Halogeometricum sp. S1BR25-6]MDS0300329.1 hypothetical protein [Halogeometricum sp. S1BR25-6]
MARTNRQRFWDLLCAFENAVMALFAVALLILLLTLLTLANLNRLSPAATIITQVNLVLATVLLLSTGYVLYRCRD